MSSEQELVFVSTRFLFPVDSGGKIRTTQVLRGLLGGAFRVVLLSPASPGQISRYKNEITEVCDEFRPWPTPWRSPLFHYARLRFLFDPLPLPVRTDWSRYAADLVADAVASEPAVAVFDFAHSAVLLPDRLKCPSVMFTHNVEAEIFRRHFDVASNALARWVWKTQYQKMKAFEKRTFKRFDVVVAVAQRDKQQFLDEYELQDAVVIPTGVDLEYFQYRAPASDRRVVFLGSMDWLANQDGVSYFMNEIWAKIISNVPDATMTVVGRSPPKSLVNMAARKKLNWSFTDLVDDVRPFVWGASAFVIPLRVGGGTRLKVYEAMAMGTPVISTSLGVEGLPVRPGEHFLEADNSEKFASEVSRLLVDQRLSKQLSEQARHFVEGRFSYERAAAAFENACTRAIERYSRSVGVSNSAFGSKSAPVGEL